MTGKFVIANEAELEDIGWGRSRWLSNRPATGAKQLLVSDLALYPGKGHDFHKHPDQEEMVYVLAGTIEQWIDREKRNLGTGDSAFIPADVVHATFNVGEADARLLVILGPCVGTTGYEVVDMSDVAPWKTLR